MVKAVFVVLGLVVIVIIFSVFENSKQYDKLLAKVKSQAEICNKYQRMLYSAESAREFFFDLESLDSNIDLLFSFQGINKKVDNATSFAVSNVRTQYSSFNKDFQWPLRDAIERQAKKTIAEIKTTLKTARKKSWTLIIRSVRI